MLELVISAGLCDVSKKFIILFIWLGQVGTKISPR